MNIIRRIVNCEIFDLGISAALYMCLLFSIAPLISAFSVAGTNYMVSSSRAWRFDEINMITLLCAYIGIITFAVGYIWSGRILRRKTTNILVADWGGKRVSLVFWGLMLSGFAIKMVRNFPLHDLMDLLSYRYWMEHRLFSLNALHFIALAVAFTRYFSLRKAGDKEYVKWKYIAWGSMIVELGILIPASPGRMSIISPILACLIIDYYMNKRSNLKIVGIAVLILVLIFPVKTLLKNTQPMMQTYFNAKTDSIRAGFHDQNTAGSDSSSAGRLLGARDLVVDSSLGRLSQLHVLRSVINNTDQYLYGNGFLDFFTALAPSTKFWASRPSFVNEGNDFGRAYELLDRHDSVTGIGPTHMGDLYLNFGIVGIIVGMFVVGILFRWIYHNLIAIRSDSGIMFYGILWIQLIHGLEDWLSFTYANMLKVGLTLLVVHVLLNVEWWRRLCSQLHGRQSEPVRGAAG